MSLRATPDTKSLYEYLMGLQARMADPDFLHPVLVSMAEIMVRSIAYNFEVGGRFSMRGGVAVGGTEKWKPSYRAQLQSGQTLLDTGRLAASLSFYEIKGRTILMGSNLIYAPVHHYGARIVPVKALALRYTLADGRQVMSMESIIPARPFLVVQDQDITLMRTAINRHMAQNIGRLRQGRLPFPPPFR